MLRMSFKMIKKIIPLKADYKMPTQPGKRLCINYFSSCRSYYLKLFPITPVINT